MTLLYTGTVQKQCHRTLPYPWRREPSGSVHQVPCSHQSGEI